MDFTTLGRTGVRVSVTGLGCGGFSRLGISTGGSEAAAVALVRLALDSGINLIDTAAQYGTEGIVGQALRGVKRDSVVVATKAQIVFGARPVTPARMMEGLEESLRQLGTDYVDVFQMHGIAPAQYETAMAMVPALLRAPGVERGQRS